MACFWHSALIGVQIDAILLFLVNSFVYIKMSVLIVKIGNIIYPGIGIVTHKVTHVLILI